MLESLPKTTDENRANIKIVHLTTVHHPYDPRIFHKQCYSLANAGFDVTLISPPLPEGETIEGLVKHIPLRKQNSRIKRMVLSTMELYRKAKKLQAHIYVFHDPELMPIGAMLKKKNNIVIYDIHEDYVTSITQKTYIRPFIRIMIAKGYKWIEKLCTRKMELSLAEKYYKDIYPGGVCILNYPIKPEVKKAEEKKESVNRNGLLYTGNVTEDRGAFIHANIPNIIKDVHVHFIGKCAGGLAQVMKAIVNDNNEKLHFVGIDEFVPKNKIDEAYGNSRWIAGIALFPPTEHYMKKELTKFFEYMGHGLPIICSNFPVWESFVKQYECGIAVDPLDNNAIKEAITYLQKNEEVALQMGRNGMQAVRDELNWYAEEIKMIRWYEQLLKESVNI